jgi:Txe/YoeB family toxin of Txe-Axe toxin-antitoxin module
VASKQRVGYTVKVVDEVRRLDLPKLLEIDPRLGRVVAEIIRELYSDPWIGRELRERRRMEILRHCRKVLFDLPSRRGKPRFRLVYRNDPFDGSIAVVTVLAVGPRSELEAYREAATRLGQRERRRTPA